ncbi:MAG: DUF3119 family protein [Geitlerinemataceae cyanobacterium]
MTQSVPPRQPSEDIASQETVRLAPSYAIPIVIVLVAIPLVLLSPWLAGAIGLFGIFLLVQTTAIRLEFTATGLDVLRNDERFRQFPYRDWLNWEIFWSPVPILFYFREVNSIHFIPVLFDATALRDCLERRVPLESLPNSAIDPPQS